MTSLILPSRGVQHLLRIQAAFPVCGRFIGENCSTLRPLEHSARSDANGDEGIMGETLIRSPARAHSFEQKLLDTGVFFGSPTSHAQ